MNLGKGPTSSQPRSLDLDALCTAFCQDNSHHLDVTPRQLGVTVPTYPEIPVFGDRQISAQNGNLVYNPGLKKSMDGKLIRAPHWFWTRACVNPATVPAQ